MHTNKAKSKTLVYIKVSKLICLEKNCKSDNQLNTEILVNIYIRKKYIFKFGEDNLLERNIFSHKKKSKYSLNNPLK